MHEHDQRCLHSYSGADGAWRRSRSALIVERQTPTELSYRLTSSLHTPANSFPRFNHIVKNNYSNLLTQTLRKRSSVEADIDMKWEGI